MGFTLSGSVVGLRIGKTGTGKEVTFAQVLSTDEGGERNHLYDLMCFGSPEDFPYLKSGGQVNLAVSVDVYSGRRGPQLSVNHYPQKRKSESEKDRHLSAVEGKKQSLPG